MCSCPEKIRTICPSFRLRTLPCWEIEGTFCKLEEGSSARNISGRDISVCSVCRVYKRYGHNVKIEIKLEGQGIDPGLIRNSGD